MIILVPPRERSTWMSDVLGNVIPDRVIYDAPERNDTLLAPVAPRIGLLLSVQLSYDPTTICDPEIPESERVSGSVHVSPHFRRI
jgi:hypothetical protein